MATPIPPLVPTAPMPLATDSDAQFDAKAFPALASLNPFGESVASIGTVTLENANFALASAVAAAAGNLSDAQRALFAGGVVGISEATGNPLEAVDIVEIEAATVPQAQAGTATAVYMDPVLTKAAIDAQVPPLISAATTDVSAGGVGSYAFAWRDHTNASLSFGDTVAGSQLRPAAFTLVGGLSTTVSATIFGSGSNVYGSGGTSVTALSGTWRCMGQGFDAGSSSTTGRYAHTLWLRIS